VKLKFDSSKPTQHSLVPLLVIVPLSWVTHTSETKRVCVNGLFTMWMHTGICVECADDPAGETVPEGVGGRLAELE